MPRPQRGVPLLLGSAALHGDRGYLFFGCAIFEAPFVTYQLPIRVLPSDPSSPMSDNARSTRVRGWPNPDAFKEGLAKSDAFKKAKARYRTFNEAASTEYQRLLSINSKKTLTPKNNPQENTIFFLLFLSCECKVPTDAILCAVYIFRWIFTFMYSYVMHYSYRSRGSSKTCKTCEATCKEMIIVIQ